MKFFEKKIAITVILIAALNSTLSGMYNINLISLIVKNNNILKKLFNFIVIGAIVWSVSNLYSKEVMLPFLGEAVYPCGSLEEKTPINWTRHVHVKVNPNSKVIFWAAEPKDEKEINDDGTYKSAYKNYSNYGVAISDSEGHVTLKFRDPREYSVPRKGLLNPHVHYRVCLGGGMMSKLYTKYLE